MERGGAKKKKKEIKRGRKRNQWKRRETRVLKKWRLREENIKKDKVRWQLKEKEKRRIEGRSRRAGADRDL